MHLIAYLHVALTTRLAELRQEPERGDSPVPTAVIIFGLVAVAMAVTALAMARANNWMNAVPNNTAP
ncbi:hypothetical protein JNW88_19220 [Micromonospora sp. ATA32]|jgi:hypothetical protein|nr:hypothetical protein [Micromonospora sp. ATA32]